MFVEGHLWQEQRRFTLRHLRDLGFAKTSIENHMLDEVNDLLSEITNISNSNQNHVVDFDAIFTVSVINVLWVIVGGKRYNRNDTAFQNLLNNVERFLRGGKSISASFPIPDFLIRLFPSLPKLMGADNDLFVPVQKFIEVQ